MLARDNAPASASALSNDGSNKLVRLLRKRLRQFALAAAALLVVLGVAAGGVAIWRLTSLNGLPDIGDPFDASAFRAIRMPDEQNAFTYYRRAQEALSPFPELPRAVIAGAASVPWSKADPKLREWVAANGAALRWLLMGADQADGIFVPGAHHDAGRDDTIRVYLTWLAFLEGGRREQAGDMTGAWTHYRSVLRMTSHLSRRVNFRERFSTNAKMDGLRKRLQSWAADPRTTIPQLRRALDELVEKGVAFEPDSFSLKRDYLEIMQLLDDPNGYLEHGQGDDLLYRFGDMQLPPDLAARVYAARRFLIREPDRSRRVLRLVFANWLAQSVIPPEQRPKPAVKVLTQVLVEKVALPIYPVSPEAPAGARVRSPREIGEWLVSTHDARRVLGSPLRAYPRLEERRTYRSLVVLLANELYRRERGAYPPSDLALVGTYLKRLPDDPSDEWGDGTTPTVSD
ncbi:MAG: hypothetical protein ACLQIB_25305 [Isosphaeraceae bacterium]